MRNTYFGAAVAAVLSVTSFAADAGTVAPGTYEIGDAQTNGDIGHGLYLNNFINPDMGYDARRWSIQSGAVTVGADGGMDFSAVVQNVWAEGYGADLRLQIDVSLDALEGPGPTDPTCQNNACAGFGAVNEYQYYEAAGGLFGTLSGLGDLAGWAGDLSIYPTNLSKPPQFGIGGSWFNAILNLENVGFTTWMEWTLAPTVEECFGQCDFLLAGNDYQLQYGYGGTGDINWLLGEPVNQVPLPAAGWLMIAGLGGLGAASRRRKSKA